MPDRLLWFWRIAWRGWYRPVIGIFAGIGAYDTVVAQFYPDSGMEPIASYIPYLQFWHWWIILLVFIIIVLIEGSYRVNKAIVQEIEAKQRIVHSDSASRLFAIGVRDCEVKEAPDQGGLQIIELSLMLTLTAYPAQAIDRDGIYLYFHGDKYKESTGAFMVMPGKTLFEASPMFGQTVRFKLPSKFTKGTYSAQIVVYVDGREETQDFKFEY